MSHSRPALTIGSIAALALIGVVAAASPALADSTDISTSSVVWEGVNDATGEIEDAHQYDVATRIAGWTTDAFDGFGLFTLADPASGQAWQFAADPGGLVAPGTTIVDGDSSVLSLSGTTDWTGPNYTVVLTLTLTGDYARWSYAVAGDDVSALVATFRGELGSDGDTRYRVDGRTMVSTDGGNGDPVLGYTAATNATFDGWTTGLTDAPSVQTTGASVFSVDLVYADYNACGFDEAQAFVTRIAPALPDTFGQSHATAGDCLEFEPVSLTQGQPVDRTLTYAVHPALIDGGYFANTIATAMAELPAGLDYSAEQQGDGAVLLSIFGTPTDSGEFTSSILFSVPRTGQTERAVAAAPGGRSLVADVVFTIAGPVVTATPIDPPAVVDPAPGPTAALPPAPAPPVVTVDSPVPATVGAAQTAAVPVSVPAARTSLLPATGFEGGRAVGWAGLAGLFVLLGTILLGLRTTRTRVAP